MKPSFLFFASAAYSEGLYNMPADLLESELNRLNRADNTLNGRTKATLIRTELNRRAKLYDKSQEMVVECR